MTDEVVTRLYRVLVDELRRRGHSEGSPVKVSELYQTLVPYRGVRAALGVELNADYEHALLRLLSGERGLLRLEPADARDELRREVDAPYPSVGLFRKFSASNVWVEMPKPSQSARPTVFPTAEPANRTVPTVSGRPPARAREESSARPLEALPGEAPPAHSRPDESGPTRIAAEADGIRLRRGSGAEPALQRPAVQLHSPSERAVAERLTTAGAACAFCDDELPSGRRVRFCPHCGGDQRLQPCPRCEAVLERDWRYCIRCGHETGAG